MSVMPDEGPALQQAMQQIDQLHHAISQSVSAFDGLFAHEPPAPPEGAGAAELKSSIDQITQLAATLGTEIGQKLVAAVEAMREATSTLISDAKTHASEWAAAYQTLRSAMTDFEHVLEAAATEANSRLSQLISALEKALSTLTQMVEDFAKKVEAFASTLVHTIADKLKSTAEKFVDDHMQFIQKVVEDFEHVFTTAVTAITTFVEDAEHKIVQAFETVVSAVTQFAHNLVNDIKSKLEEMGAKLATGAVESLTGFVSSSLVEGTAGAALTGTISPILPEVIIVKEASEVIKDLVSVFKAVASVF